MSDIWASQLDYIYFLYGLSFIIFGGICVSMQRFEGNGTAWGTLALFGLLHGLCEWLDLIAISIGDSYEFSILRVIAKLMSFLMLFCFCLKCKGVGTCSAAIIAAILAVVFLFSRFIIASSNEADDIARWFVALPGSLWVAFLLYQRACRDDKGYWLKIVAGAFVAYGFAAGLIVPSSPIAPTWAPTHQSFISLTHFPIQVLRGLIAVFAAISIWRYEIEHTPSGSGNIKLRFFWRTMAFLLIVEISGLALVNIVHFVDAKPESHRIIIIFCILVVSVQVIVNYIITKIKINADVEREKAEISNKSKSMFLAMMSHELRTPLNSIIGFSEIIRDHTFGPSSVPEYHEYAGYINRAGHHLLILVNDILDLSKIEAGKMELDIKNLKVSDIIQDSTRIIGVRAGQKGIDFRVEQEIDDLRVLADERAFRQILFNLLSNAIKFTPGGGAITIYAGLTANGRIIVEVRDTGIGIQPNNIPRIIKPFEQSDNRFSKSEGGTGLGLTVVQELVRLHNGELQVSSTPGKGSVFAVIFHAP